MRIIDRISDISDALKISPFCVLKRAVDPVLIDTFKHSHSKCASFKILPTGTVGADIPRTLCSKWSIGGFNGTQAEISRLMITSYYPMSEWDRILGAREVFGELEKVREEVGVSWDKGKGFNCYRTQYYPAGGGFMSLHRDDVAVTNFNLSATEGRYLQMVLLGGTFGRDYAQGGAVVVVNDEVINIEQECSTESGDLVVYDANILHGVEDIDPHLEFSPDGTNGRLVFMMSRYV